MTSQELRDLFERRYSPKKGGAYLLHPIDALAFMDIALEFGIEILELEYFTVFENGSIQPDMGRSFSWIILATKRLSSKRPEVWCSKTSHGAIFALTSVPIETVEVYRVGIDLTVPH